MSSNRLCLNSAKTQLIWFGTGPQLAKLDFPLLSQMFPAFTFSASVRDLGVTLDSNLTFKEHLSTLTRSCFYHLRRLRAIRRSVSLHVFTTIVHAFVCSRIDYCNSLYAGLPKVRLSTLQSVLNSAARLIARFPRFSHISTFMMNKLHWLPTEARIQYKILHLLSIELIMARLLSTCVISSVNRFLFSLSGPFALVTDLTFSFPGPGQPLLNAAPLQLWVLLCGKTFPTNSG